MNDFFAGALIGLLLLLIFGVAPNYSNIKYAIKYDLRRSLKKNYKGILIAILVAGCWGGSLFYFDNGSDAPCRSFGNSRAESC